MNKKILLIFILSLFIITIVATNVHAQAPTAGAGIGDTLYDVLGWVGDINIANVGEDAKATFYARFLIWIFIFAVLFYVAGFIFKENKKVATTVALVVAIIGALGIPANLLAGVMQTYSIVFVILLVAIPVFAVFWLTRAITKEFKNSPRVAHFLSAIAFWITLIAMTNVNEGIVKNYNVFNYTQWFGFAFAICELLMLWHIVALILGFGVESSPAEKVAEGGKELWDKLKDTVTGGPALAERYEVSGLKLLKDAEKRLEIYKQISRDVDADGSIADPDKPKEKEARFSRYKDQVLKDLKQVKKIDDMLLQMEVIQNDFVVKLKGSPQATAKALVGRIEPAIVNLIARTRYLQRRINTIIKAIEKDKFNTAMGLLEKAIPEEAYVLAETDKIKDWINKARKYIK